MTSKKKKQNKSSSDPPVPAPIIDHFTIDGSKCNSVEEFYDEIERSMFGSREVSWGRNLDAFNDILRGGFGNIPMNHPFTIVWKSSKKSQANLGNKFNKLVDIITRPEITLILE